jgi:hypothetical protein
MKKPMILICIICIFLSCESVKDNSISIYFENNNDLDSTLIIDTYVNGEMCASTKVNRNTTRLYDASEIVKFKENGNEAVSFKFIVKSKEDSTTCTIQNNQLDSIYYLHVNFVTTVFAKGFTVFDRVLEKDSVAHHEFSCQPILKNHGSQ